MGSAAKKRPRPRKLGLDLLHDPLLNKGTAFTRAERERLGITGLLPASVFTPEAQAARVISYVRRDHRPLDKYIEMLSLLDRNTTLFYRVVTDHIEELLPIIYTPTVGLGCQLYAHLFRRSRGLFITRREKGKVKKVLRHWPRRDVR